MSERGARLWNRLAKRYAASPIRHQEDYEEKLRITREYLDSDASVFEFGCGTGSTALEHAPHVKHIHATDYSSAMIDIARGKADAAGITNVEFECVSIDKAGKPDGSVDVVMGHSILHLLGDVPGVLRKVHAMLKPGGIFISSTGCLKDMSIGFRILLPVLRAIRIAPYVNVFSQPELEAMLTDAGFQLERQWRPAKNKAAFIIAKKT